MPLVFQRGAYTTYLLISKHTINLEMGGAKMAWRKLLFFHSSLSISISLSNRSILITHTCFLLFYLQLNEIVSQTVFQLSVAGIQFAGMYSPMHSGNKVYPHLLLIYVNRGLHTSGLAHLLVYCLYFR